jgi:AcrR family transcriptional regulator
MGRPREFDIEQAVLKASDLFWRKGFDHTSVQDLTKAMGITPPSFYFAFGNKEALFLRVVEAYQEVQAGILADALLQPTSREVVARLLDGFAHLLTQADRAPGCLVMNSALPVSETHSFRRLFAEQRAAFRLHLRRRFEQAKAEEKTWPARFDPDALSRLIVAVIWGFAVEAQSGANREDLRQTVAALLVLWPG